MKFTINYFFRFVLLLVITVPAPHAVGMQEDVFSANAFEEISYWKRWQEMLLNAPREALSRAQETKRIWLTCSTAQWCNEYQNYVCQCPFFMLDECCDDECSLTRTKGHRETFEKSMSQRLVWKIDRDPDEFVHYVGFGAGYLFSDFLILVRTLHARPKAKILLSAVDPSYKLDWWDQMNESLQPDEHTILRIRQLRIEHPHFMNYGVQQLKKCIGAMFPDATLEIKLIDNYVMKPRQLVEDLDQKPDLIVMADVSACRSYYSFLYSFLEV